MTRRHTRWWPVLIASLVPLILGLLSHAMAWRSDSLLAEQLFDVTDLAWVATMVAAAGTGASILLNRRRHGVGRALLAYGLGGSVGVGAYGLAVVFVDAGAQPAAASAESLGSACITATFVLVPASLLLFPAGTLPSPRWRPVGWLIVATSIGGFIAAFVNGGFMGDVDERVFGPGPLRESLGGVADALIGPGFLALAACVVAASASIVVRFRRSTGEERLQMKWVVAAALFLLTTVVAVFVEGGLSESATGSTAILLSLGLTSIPVAMGIAILKYHLYGIDVVISKSVTYLGLGAAITLLYAAVVAGPLLISGQSDRGGPGLVVPIAATALVAVLFEPIRTRTQRWADRLVYGKRSTPHELLSRLTAQLSETAHDSGTDDLAKLLAEGTGADHAVVWLRSGDFLVPEGSWPADRSTGMAPLPAQELAIDEFTLGAPVRHGEDLLGALSITKPRNDPIAPPDRELLADAAAGAGLMLRNIGLNRQLEERARQVRESRFRLIAAQDAERHRLERDLHDGAQQQVVALKVKLGIAKTIAEREGVDDVVSLISALAADTQDAVDALRAVAHGIYPPLLEADGLEVALRAVQRTSARPLVIETSGLTRYARPVEETVYFCALEALERARMAGAGSVRIGLADSGDELVLEIDHDRPTTEAELTAMSDRVDAFGGTTAIETLPDEVFRITSRIPVRESELAFG